MKKKVLIVSVLNHLQRRDPEWETDALQVRLKVLYSGWTAKCIRQHKHDKHYFSRKWREGSLPLDEYLDFFNYVMQ